MLYFLYISSKFPRFSIIASIILNKTTIRVIPATISKTVLVKRADFYERNLGDVLTFWMFAEDQMQTINATLGRMMADVYTPEGALREEMHLDPRVIAYCRLTSWRDKQGTPWLQIPYYSRDGKLIGIQNRNLIKGASPRFRFPQGAACSIYNLPVLNLLKPGNGVHNRLDGSILVGAYNCLNSLIHPRDVFDPLYERIRKSVSRGNQVTLTIKDC